MQNPIVDIQNTLVAIENNYLIGNTDFELLGESLAALAKQVRQCEGGTPRGTAKKVYIALINLSKDGVAAAYWWHRFETRRTEFYKLKMQAIAEAQVYLEYCQQEIELGSITPLRFGAAA